MMVICTALIAALQSGHLGGAALDGMVLGDREGVRHVADVLDEQQVAEVLDQVDDEAAEVLPLIGELLDERERVVHPGHRLARELDVDDRADALDDLAFCHLRRTHVDFP